MDGRDGHPGGDRHRSRVVCVLMTDNTPALWPDAFDRYMEKYGRVYNPVENEKAEAERAEVNARRNAKKAKKQ